MADGSAGAPETAAGGINPWLIALVISVATFMEVLDTTIANVALRYIAGGLGVSTDESSWTVTTYLVANAIVLTASSYLSKRFGRKNFFLACLALFTVSSLFCGLVNGLGLLLLFRVLQGFAGGGMVPVSQSILADSFPPEKRGQAFALFGVAVVVGPVVGPTLGGWLADNVSWHWCFLINVPVGAIECVLVYLMIQEPKSAIQERKKLRKSGNGLDVTGFILVATFLGALEVVLDRGTIDDWLGSTFIAGFAVVSLLAGIVMIPWELTRKNPIIDLHMVFSRQFGSCFVVMGATGAILYGTTQFLPQLLQDYFGYTATWAGLALSPGGIVTMLMMFVIGQVGAHVQPKWLIATGAAIIALSMWNLTNTFGELNFGWFAWSRIYLGFGLPLIFIPITTASYAGVPKTKTDQASALINMARNVGGSIGVSLCNNVLAHRQQFHQTRLAEHVSPTQPAYQDLINTLSTYFSGQGATPAVAQNQAFAYVGQVTQTQAGYLAYIDVWWTLMLLSAAAVPLALILRNVKLGGGGGAAH